MFEGVQGAGSSPAAIFIKMPSILFFLPLGVHPFFEAYHTFFHFTRTSAATATPKPKTTPSPVGIPVGCGKGDVLLESEKASVSLCVQNKNGKPDHVFILKLKLQNLI